MTNHKVSVFESFDDFKTYVESLGSTVTIQVLYSPRKGWVVVE